LAGLRHLLKVVPDDIIVRVLPDAADKHLRDGQAGLGGPELLARRRTLCLDLGPMLQSTFSAISNYFWPKEKFSRKAIML
jgi:hypothetical protein